MIGLTKYAPGPGNVALRERPEREPEGDEILVEVSAAGICGTDLHIEAGEYAALAPVTMGHEVAGTVAAVGPGADPSWVGARVVVETFFSTCTTCAYCRAGRLNLCPERRSIGTHVDGAFAPRLIVPQRNAHRVPESLPDSAAPLIEPLACVCHCLFRFVNGEPLGRVLVTGPGPIGILAAQVARSRGGDVVVSGLPSDEPRLEVARRLGFEVALAGDEPTDVDVAVETSGNAAGANAALTCVRRGGVYAQLGIFGRPVTIDYDLVLLKELDLHATFASCPPAWEHALDLVAGGAVALEPLVSAVVPLADWAAAFDDLRRGRALKIVLDPRQAS
jgi:L-iditol 2-dehydrogenase